MMKIYINSRGRADRQPTLEQIPRMWRSKTYVVVRECEAQMYRDSVADDIAILSYPDEGYPYLPEQRQWVVEHADVPYVFLMDDDLIFNYRPMVGKTNLKKVTEESMEQMLTTVLTIMRTDQYGLVGISDRYGNDKLSLSEAENGRVSRAYCVNRDIFIREGLNFAPISPFVMEDFHINLCLLEKGYPNRVLYNWAQGDASGSNNAEGGCTSYRDFEVQKRSALKLKELHPQSVDFKFKQTTGTWSGMQQHGQTNVRADVIVHWKKAFRPRRRKGGGILDFIH